MGNKQQEEEVEVSKTSSSDKYMVMPIKRRHEVELNIRSARFEAEIAGKRCGCGLIVGPMSSSAGISGAPPIMGALGLMLVQIRKMMRVEENDRERVSADEIDELQT